MQYWYWYRLNKVYERLRKRSYRRWRSAENSLNRTGQLTDPWRVYQHKAYVKGVHDAVLAMELELGARR